ncbi:hypothetical protein NKG94_08335 [Micromonospora sp. M12]
MPVTETLLPAPQPAETRPARRGGVAAVGLVLGGPCRCSSVPPWPRCSSRVPGGRRVTLRLTIAAVLLLVVPPRLRGHDRSAWLAAGAFGLALAGMNSLFYQAIDRIPLGPAVTLEVLGRWRCRCSAPGGWPAGAGRGWHSPGWRCSGRAASTG